MGAWKRITCFLCAVFMAVAVLAVPGTQAHAKAKVENSNVSIVVNNIYTGQVKIVYSKGDAQIKNLKSNSKNLIARQTSQYYHEEEYEYSDTPYGYARIGFYARKTGNYKVTFDVCDVNGKKVSSHTIKVKATESGTYSSPFKKVTFAGKPIFHELTSKKSGKFKVSMNSGYKLKSISVATTDANGHTVTKTIKNNAKVTLGVYTYKHENENDYYDYDYDPVTDQEIRTPRWSYNLSTGFFAETEFRVTYVNTKTKAEGTSSFYLYRQPKN